ncbi:hypothetical protein C8J57DRAFT_627377 [Mycena rebaudengoi]|nr:hypothetical protein C8J57DRAFT_627377 [Mycena rebaudengoi]
MYSARVRGHGQDMTVAIYQGPSAEELWRETMQIYSGLRAASITQVYGTVRSPGLYATIFHDDLIPVEQILSHYQGSTVSKIYIVGVVDAINFGLGTGLRGHHGSDSLQGSHASSFCSFCQSPLYGYAMYFTCKCPHLAFRLLGGHRTTGVRYWKRPLSPL